MNRSFRLWVALVMALCISTLQVTPALAGLASSRCSDATDIHSARDADMLMAQRALENRVVAQKLKDYGVAPGDAQSRLAAMSDADLHTLASASKGLPSGGDGAGGLIGLLVVVVLVIVVIRLLHHDVIVR